MDAKAGLFITFEGLDGSGKSTHLKRLAAVLRGSGRPVVTTREPGGTPLGDQLREHLLHSETAPEDGMVEALLLFASRRQHLLQVIEPALAGGAIVLCDRFSDSSFAYQGFGRDVGLERMLDLDRLATGGRRADRSLFFDLSADAARSRGQSVDRRSCGEADRLDQESLDFYERVREGYLEVLRREPERFRIVESEGAPEVTWRGVRAALEDLFEELR